MEIYIHKLFLLFLIIFKASEEEAKVAEIKERVMERQKRCDEDLAKAEPAVRQAEAALDTLNKVSTFCLICTSIKDVPCQMKTRPIASASKYT